MFADHPQTAVLVPGLDRRALGQPPGLVGDTARTAITSGTMAVLAFIAWWKGGLMLQYLKEQEAPMRRRVPDEGAAFRCLVAKARDGQAESG
jgi:hypothetical protein